jgi:hypothetical protein
MIKNYYIDTEESLFDLKFPLFFFTTEYAHLDDIVKSVVSVPRDHVMVYIGRGNIALRIPFRCQVEVNGQFHVAPPLPRKES